MHQLRGPVWTSWALASRNPRLCCIVPFSLGSDRAGQGIGSTASYAAWMGSIPELACLRAHRRQRTAGELCAPLPAFERVRVAPRALAGGAARLALGRRPERDRRAVGVPRCEIAVE
jgi:hypothetical protein